MAIPASNALMIEDLEALTDAGHEVFAAPPSVDTDGPVSVDWPAAVSFRVVDLAAR